MKVILSTTSGNQHQGVSTVTTELELDPSADHWPIEEQVREQLEVTKQAVDTWKAWSIENETDEQRQQREAVEEMQRQHKEQVEAMLAGPANLEPPAEKRRGGKRRSR